MSIHRPNQDAIRAAARAENRGFMDGVPLRLLVGAMFAWMASITVPEVDRPGVALSWFLVFMPTAIFCRPIYDYFSQCGIPRLQSKFDSAKINAGWKQSSVDRIDY